MAERISKKSLILDFREQQHLESADVRELRRIQSELRDRLTPAKPPSLSYIAAVLREAGTRVDYDDPYGDAAMPERYRSRLQGVLHFHDLAATENALHALDAAWRDYRSEDDREGAALVRKLVLRGRQRAERFAANPRVQSGKRQEKREIARWFGVWLESPELFSDWLDLRKRSDDFRELFPNHAPPTNEPASRGDAES